MKHIAVNGFGRIGRNFVRAFLQDPYAQKKLKLAVINIGQAKPEYVAHMFKYDTLMGKYDADISVKDNILRIGNYSIPLITQLSLPSKIWKKYGIDWVVDCTGKFTQRSEAEKHLQEGARFVLISAPAHNEDVAIIPGVNQEQFNPNLHTIVSLGSCTTNACIPLLKVVNDAFSIERGFMTTVHAYTNSQVLLDVEAKDLRISRAAALNIIPTSTGISGMITKIIPALDQKIMATSIRVPVGKVSLIDLVVTVSKKVTVDRLHQELATVAQANMKNILGLTQEPLVSSDFSGNAYSVVVDCLLTQVVDNAVHLFGWYDNEWAYSVRLKDFLMSWADNF